MQPKRFMIQVMYYEKDCPACQGIVTYDALSVKQAFDMHKSDYPKTEITMAVSYGDAPNK